MKKLNLGCGRNRIEGWINVDSSDLPGVDLVVDLDACSRHPLPIEDDSIDEILGIHFLEHIRDPLALMQELHRVAKPGARATFIVPYGSSDDAMEDPTHRRQYFVGSFGYFGQPHYWRADYRYRGDWITRRIQLKVDARRYKGMPVDRIWQQIMTLRNTVIEMIAELDAVKPIREPRRDLQIPPRAEIVFDES